MKSAAVSAAYVILGLASTWVIFRKKVRRRIYADLEEKRLSHKKIGEIEESMDT